MIPSLQGTVGLRVAAHRHRSWRGRNQAGGTRNPPPPTKRPGTPKGIEGQASGAGGWERGSGRAPEQGPLLVMVRGGGSGSVRGQDPGFGMSV